MNFNLCDTLEESVQLFAASARAKSIELASHIAPNVPLLLAGEVGKLRQLLFCLLDNATHFTERGEVVVRAAKEDETATSATIRISVTDTGPGIPPDKLSKIFLQGFGTLVSCKKTAQLLGGNIGVESRIGSGSTFWLSLRFEKQLPGASVPWAQAAFPGVRALIVDDSTRHADTIRQKLTAWNIRADHAANIQDALTMLRRESSGPDPYGLALLDMQMSGIDGWSLAQKISTEVQLSSVRLVGMTSLPYLINARLMSSAGIAACLNKPIKQMDLFRCISKVLGETTPRPVLERPAPPAPPGPHLVETVPSYPVDKIQEMSSLQPAVVEPLKVDILPIAQLLEPAPIVEKTEPPPPAIETKAVDPIGRVAAPSPAAGGATTAKEDADTHKHFRVLVVAEDQQCWAKILVQLKKLGYAADAAASGSEALEAISRRPYGLMLVDLPAQSVNVSELVSDIRHRQGARKRTPIVAMVGGASASGEGLPEGISGHMLKPIKSEALAAELARWDVPVDPAILASLRAVGTEQLLSKMAHAFTEDAPGMIEAIYAAVEIKSSEDLEKTAHAFKSSSGHMGATGLHTLCTKLEALAKTDDFAEASRLLFALREEYQRVQKALAAHIKRPPAPKPKITAPELSPAVPVADPSKKPRANKKAVICDDDRTLGHIVTHVLQKHGFSVHLAENGKDGLALIREEKPGLLLLDIDMPMISGLSVLKELKPIYEKEAENPYVIVLSNHESQEMHAQAKALGAQEIIIKPFHPTELNKKIETLLQEGKI